MNLVEFLLWTPANPTNGSEQIIQFGDEKSLSESNFDSTRKTKVLVHGYTDNGRSYWIQDMRDEFFKLGDFNIISVDYYPLGIGPHYPLAAENAQPVGYHAAEFIRFLVDTTNAKLEDFHPIGFSLGGQVVGNIGHGLDGELPRVSGLDPAGFMFHTVTDTERLSKLSAKFVDVIHTAGLWKGMDEPVANE